MSCKHCQSEILSGDGIKCSTCLQNFHFFCVNMKETNFRKMGAKRDIWTCSACKDDLKGNQQSANQASANSASTAFPACGTKSLQNLDVEQIMQVVRRCIASEFEAFHAKLNILPELKESVNFISAEYEDLKKMFSESLTTIKSLQADNTKLHTQIHDLNTRVSHMEQMARETNVEIQCVPEHRSENLVAIVQRLGTLITRPIAESEILNIHRVAKFKPESNRPKAIIVKLPSVRVKDEVLAAVANFNKKNRTNKLNSAHLGIDGTKSPIYVSEHLSPAHKALHAATRIRAKETNHKFVWIRNGRIFVRKDENSARVVLIRNHDSLASLT